MKSVRKHLQKGKLYCLTHKGANRQKVRSGTQFEPGTPMLFLDYHGSNGLTNDSFKFLVGEKIEEIAFSENHRTLLGKLEHYIIPLHEWEEYLTFYTEYFKEVHAPDIQIQIQSIPIKNIPRKLPTNVVVELLPEIGPNSTTPAFDMIHSEDVIKEFEKVIMDDIKRFKS